MDDRLGTPKSYMAHELEIVVTSLNAPKKKRWEMTAAEKNAQAQARAEREANNAQRRAALGSGDGMLLQQAAMKLIQTVLNTGAGRGVEVCAALEGLLVIAHQDDVTQIFQNLLQQEDSHHHSAVCSHCLPLLVELVQKMPIAEVVPVLADVLTVDSIGKLLPKAVGEINKRPAHTKQRFMQALGASLSMSDLLLLLSPYALQMSCDDVPTVAACFQLTMEEPLQCFITALIQHLGHQQQVDLVSDLFRGEVLQNLDGSQKALLLGRGLECLSEKKLKEVFAAEIMSEPRRELIALELVGSSNAILLAIEQTHNPAGKQPPVGITYCSHCQIFDQAEEFLAPEDKKAAGDSGSSVSSIAPVKGWHEASPIECRDRQRQARPSVPVEKVALRHGGGGGSGGSSGSGCIGGGSDVDASAIDASAQVGPIGAVTVLNAQATNIATNVIASHEESDDADDADDDANDGTAQPHPVADLASTMLKTVSIPPIVEDNEDAEVVGEHLAEKGALEKGTSGMATVTAVAKFKRRRRKTEGGKRLTKAATKQSWCPKRKPSKIEGDEAAVGSDWVVPEYWTKFLKTSSIKAISTNAREMSVSKLRASVLQFYFEKAIADENAKRDNNPVPSMIRFVTESML
jgi:hypothetical protein